MNHSNNNQRTLAYKTAQVILIDELKEISGGSMTGTTTSYTTKQTADMRGNWDIGADVRWD